MSEIERHDVYLDDLGDDEFEALKQDISERGQQVPIVKDGDGIMIDGKQRLTACRSLGIEPWIISVAATGEAAQELSLTLNTKRRQLGKEQKEAIARRMIREGKTVVYIADLLNIHRTNVSPLVQEEKNNKELEVIEELKQQGETEKSDRQIASEYGVTHPTISKMKKDLEGEEKKALAKQEPSKAEKARQRLLDEAEKQPEKGGEKPNPTPNDANRRERSINLIGDLGDLPEFDPETWADYGLKQQPRYLPTTKKRRDAIRDRCKRIITFIDYLDQKEE